VLQQLHVCNTSCYADTANSGTHLLHGRRLLVIALRFIIISTTSWRPAAGWLLARYCRSRTAVLLCLLLLGVAGLCRWCAAGLAAASFTSSAGGYTSHGSTCSKSMSGEPWTMAGTALSSTTAPAALLTCV
jgi:hypothetical protein